MKSFLSTMSLCAVLLRGTCCADPSTQSPAPSSSGNSANAASNSSGQNNQTSAPPATPQALNNQSGSPQSQTGNGSENVPPANPPPTSAKPSSQAGSLKAVVTANAASPGKKTSGLNNSTARSSSAIQAPGPLFKDARNRGPAAAVVGGLPKNKMTPVISGTSVNHKPL
jgi:hypothetical protein